LCDFFPLEVLDVPFGQSYLWKRRFVYDFRPCNVIITLDKKLYKILEVVPRSVIFVIIKVSTLTAKGG